MFDFFPQNKAISNRNQIFLS